MQNQTVQEFEQDHKRDASEHATWFQEAQHWKAEHRRLLGLLDKARDAVLEQNAALDTHMRAIHEHEMQRLRHELSGSNAPTQGELAETHKRTEVSHAQSREAHERMAKHHERIHTVIDQLAGALDEPM